MICTLLVKNRLCLLKFEHLLMFKQKKNTVMFTLFTFKNYRSQDNVKFETSLIYVFNVITK